MEPTRIHGNFSWQELTTRDPAAAVEFYSRLFGWTSEVRQVPNPHAGGMMDYTIMKAGDRMVGGVLGIPPGAPAGVPVAWTSYVTVDDIEETVRMARALGAMICVPPTDVPEVGRFAIMADPQGAVIAAITYLKQ